MGNLRLYGSSSGYVEIAPPAVGGSQVLTLPTDSVQPGMMLLASQSFSAASSVSINNCFSATYTNYLILIQASSSSDGAALLFRFRASGADISGGNYFWRKIVNTTATPADADTSTNLGQVANSGNVATFASTFIRVAPYSLYTAFSAYQSAAQNVGHSGLSYNGSAADGLTIYSSAGTITGAIRVYGCRNS